MKGTGKEVKSLVLVWLSKCVPANHSEEMKNVEGKKKKKSTTHFSNFDNKRDGKRAGRRKLPLNSSFPRFLFLCAADRCHLKLQRYFLIVKGRAGEGWRDRRTGWVVE